MTLQMLRAGGVVGGLDGTQVGVERRLRVHHDFAAAGHAHHHVRAQGAFVGAHLFLLIKNTVLHHAGQFREPLQRHLAPWRCPSTRARGSVHGVYVECPDGSLRFRWVKAPTSEEITKLTDTLARRINRFLER
jgi:hypothetical protein